MADMKFKFTIQPYGKAHILYRRDKRHDGNAESEAD